MCTVTKINRGQELENMADVPCLYVRLVHVVVPVLYVEIHVHQYAFFFILFFFSFEFSIIVICRDAPVRVALY